MPPFIDDPEVLGPPRVKGYRTRNANTVFDGLHWVRTTDVCRAVDKLKQFVGGNDPDETAYVEGHQTVNMPMFGWLPRQVEAYLEDAICEGE